MSVILVVGLVSASCSNRRSEQVRVKENKNGTEDVRVQKHQNNDTVSVDKSGTYRRDNEGNVQSKSKVDKNVNKNDNTDQNTRKNR
jgi:cytochrome c biogenesis protein ResB